jgi:hypothetical protein
VSRYDASVVSEKFTCGPLAYTNLRIFAHVSDANGDKPNCVWGMKTFGEVIAELRKERGLTQKALASQIKKRDGIAIGIAYINDIEHDRRNPPSPDFVVQLGSVGSTTRGSSVLRRSTPAGRETGRSITSADCGSLPRVSEGD